MRLYRKHGLFATVHILHRMCKSVKVSPKPAHKRAFLLIGRPTILRFTQYSGHMSSLFFEEIYCFFLKKCNLNTPPGKLIFSNIFRRSIFLFQRYHYFVIGIQLMFIQ